MGRQQGTRAVAAVERPRGPLAQSGTMNDKTDAGTTRIAFASHHGRRGSVYVAILGASMIVTVIGLSALLATRIEHRSVAGAGDFAKARFYAVSAIDRMLLVIQQGSEWRKLFAYGALPASQPIGNGSMGIEAIDPVDGDLANNGTDPVLLTGIGYSGNARYKLQVMLDGNGIPTPGTWRRVVD